MMNGISRRQFTGLGLAALSAPAVTSLMNGTAFAQDAVDMRFLWWGGEERANRTLAAIARYKELNPNVTINGETLGWDGYWARVATQVAGGNPPDIIQMDFQYIAGYAQRGSLYALDEFMPDTIDLADFDSYILDSVTVDGKLYGVGLGENTITWLYDKVKLDELGLEPPRVDWTWEEFSELAEEIYKRGGGEYWGSMDFNKPNTLEIWVRQRGKALYTADGQLGFDVEDVIDWFEFLDDLRRRGAIVPAEVQALDPGESITESMLALGKACIISCSTNQLVAYQKAAPGGHELGMVMAPSGGPDAAPGQWAGPSQLLCIAPSASNKLEAARFINFMVKDPDAVNILGVERGVPPSASMRDAVVPSLTDVEARTVHFMSAVADKVGALPPPPPQGATEIYPLLVRHNAAVGFERATPADAAKAFYADAQRILSK